MGQVNLTKVNAGFKTVAPNAHTLFYKQNLSQNFWGREKIFQNFDPTFKLGSDAHKLMSF